MRIALDTNILVSVAISTGKVYRLFNSLFLRHDVITSQYILDEFKKVLADKFHLPHDQINEVTEIIFRKLEFVEPLVINDIELEDINDLPILGTALAGKCQYLISGDKGLYLLKNYHQIRIVKPADFPSELL